METNFTTQDLQDYIISKKMKIIFSNPLIESFTSKMTQKQLDALLKLSLPTLTKKLDDLELKILVGSLRGKIQTEPIKK
jgi:two-component SAPR family response regulator